MLKAAQNEIAPNKKKKRRRPKSLIRRNLKTWLRFFPFLAPLIVTAFAYTWLHTRLNIVTLPIQNLRAKKTYLIKQNDSIRVSIERLQAPDRIESIARTKLGMVSPEKWQIVAIDEPLQTPTAAREVVAAQDTVPPGQKTAGLFGFLKRGWIFGNASVQQTLTVKAGQSR